MTNPEERSSEGRRSQLIALLWELKNQVEKARITGFAYVHYNYLLKDHLYRAEVLERAKESGDGKLRLLAEDISKLDMPGKLLRTPAETVPEQIAADQPADAGWSKVRYNDGRMSQSSTWMGGIAISLTGLIAVGTMIAYLTGASFMGGRVKTADHLISSDITTNTVWKAGVTYLLDSPVFVSAGATLKIEPGVLVKGMPGSALIIARDGKIDARGTASDPVVFTSSQPYGQRKRGDWGGVVLLGEAPVNGGVGHIEGIDENDPRGSFGGADSAHNCGTLQFVRIEFAGYEAFANNELNGLTLGGCGDSTVLRDIQVHMSLDDGVEFFGGTANISNLLITRPGDDGLDWDRGWQGNGQFIIVQMEAGDGDSAIEADNLKKDHGAKPLSHPSISNLTLIGSRDPRAAQRGMVLRHGTGADLRNLIITGFGAEAFDLRDPSTIHRLESGELRFQAGLAHNAGMDFIKYFAAEAGKEDDDGGFDELTYFSDESHGMQLDGNPDLLEAAFNLDQPNFTPLSVSRASKGVAVPQGEFWAEGANFMGAVRPGEKKPWYQGWTSFPQG